MNGADAGEGPGTAAPGTATRGTAAHGTAPRDTAVRGTAARRPRIWQRPRAHLALWLLVLAASAAFYAWQDSLLHFLWHVGYGASAGLVAGAAWSVAARRRLPAPSLWGLAGYAWMAVPDLIWLAGLWASGSPWPHRPWMDLFLVHYSLDLWPLATAALPAALLPAAALAWWRSRSPRRDT